MEQSMAKEAQTNIGRALAEAGVAGVPPAIAAAVAPAIAAATAARSAVSGNGSSGVPTAPIAAAAAALGTQSGAAGGRLPAFDPTLAEQLPNSVSRVAFMDKWVTCRIDEAAATTARMDRQLTQLARAQEAMQKLGESLRAEIATVGPTMNLLHEAEESAQESAQKLAQEIAKSASQSAERIAREHVESFLDDSRRAVSAALEPVEQQCAQRLEAMLQEADARMDAASKHVVARTREELRLMEQQWLSAAQQVRDSLNDTLAAAQITASQLADTIEKTLASAGAAAEALARHGTGEVEKPIAAESGQGSGAAAERCDVGPGVTVSIPDGVAAAGDRALRALDAASVVIHRAA
jgi:hypothetical protein